MNGIAADTGEAINDDGCVLTPLGLFDCNLFRGDRVPALFIHFDPLVIPREKIISLKPVLVNNTTHPFFNQFPSLMGLSWENNTSKIMEIVKEKGSLWVGFKQKRKLYMQCKTPKSFYFWESNGIENDYLAGAKAWTF